MTEIIIPPIPEKAFDDPWHEYMVSVHDALTTLVEAQVVEEEDGIDEDQNAPLLGDFYTPPTTEGEVKGVGTAFSATFKVASDKKVFLSVSISAKKSVDEGGAVLAIFDVFVNSRNMDRINIGITNDFSTQVTRTYIINTNGQLNVRVEQAHSNEYILEPNGKNNIVVLELKE